MLTRSNNLKLKIKNKLADDVFEYTLIGDDFSDINIGQFINIKVDGFYLRRPISVKESSKDEVKITFKILGDGTDKLSQVLEGDNINCLYPLGQGFDLSKLKENKDQRYNKEPKKSKNILIIGGGIGVPPLVGLYKELVKLSSSQKFNNLNAKTSFNIETILGFKDEDQVIYKQEFENAQISLDNIDGNIIEYMKKNKLNKKYEDYYIFSCGPKILLDTLALMFKDGQMLLEERMGCGFGACMGCSKKVGKDKYKRVCVEGPMFYLEEVRYELENNN